MAKCNSTKNNRNGLKVFAIIVSILLVVCLVASLCVIGRTTNGFKEIPEFDDDEVEEDAFVVEPESDPDADRQAEDYSYSPVTLSVAKIPEEDYGVMGIASESIGAYTVTASYFPSNADITGFTWSLALDTTFSGYQSSGDYTDYYGTVWSSSSAFDMSDYITLSGDDTLSCTVTCNQVFGCPIILSFTVTDFSGDSYSANCNLNCNTYKTGFYWIAYSSKSCSVTVTTENTDIFEGIYIDTHSPEYSADRVSYSFSENLISIENGEFSSSSSASCSSILVSTYLYVPLEPVYNSDGEVRYYDWGVQLYSFGKFIDEADYVCNFNDRLLENGHSDFVDVIFQEMRCYLEPVFNGVYSIGTLACAQSDSDALASLGVTYSVKSGVDGSTLVSSTSCSSTVSFSVDSCLSEITDDNGVALTRDNLGRGNVSSSFMKQFCDSSHPILNIEFSCGGSTVTCPFYFSDISYFNVALTGATVDSLDLVFN